MNELKENTRKDLLIVMQILSIIYDENKNVALRIDGLAKKLELSHCIGEVLIEARQLLET